MSSIPPGGDLLANSPPTTSQKRQRIRSNRSRETLPSKTGRSTTPKSSLSTGNRMPSQCSRASRPGLRLNAMEEASTTNFIRASGPDFVVGFDFGTTFTTVAFVKPKVDRNDIITIERFPSDPVAYQTGKHVPTESWYPSSPRSLFNKDESEGAIESTAGTEPRMNIDESIFQSSRSLPLNDKNPICEGYLFGYEVAPHIALLNGPGEDHRKGVHVTRMKLMLDGSDLTRNIRSDLYQSLDLLKSNKRIRGNSDVIRDFLTVTILHTIRELERYHGFDADSKVEVVMCVPVCWAATSNYIMCKAMNEAMRATGFGVSTDGTVLNLFVVNEAEAAATSCLRENRNQLRRNEIFILLDCGGGTVDTGTYKIGREDPLRLYEQVFQPAGALCGSSYLNEAMRQFSMSQLKDEQYLERYRRIPIHIIIEKDVILMFENTVKRGVDFERKGRSFRFPIDGLRESPTNPRLKNNSFVVNYHDMMSIFEPCLLKIKDLMEKQIKGALNERMDVDKVVLVGGFGDSPALRKFLHHIVSQINENYGTSIQLITAPPNMSITSVAAGAIMRALDKTGGPKRMPVLSIGVSRTIPFEDETIEQPEYAPLLKAKRIIERYTGIEYVPNTITWLIKVGVGPVASVFRDHFFSEAFFGSKKDNWAYREALYASDVCNEDHYTRQHSKNKGKTLFIGNIEVNLNHLKPFLRLKNPRGKWDGEPRYEVKVRVEYEIIDRDMKFTVRWPAEANGDVIEGSQKTICLAAAFEPGTM